MIYEIVFTETAKQDLKDISMYIANMSKSISVAKEFVIELVNNLNILKEYPNSGSFPKDRILISYGYRYLTYKDYLTFYTIDEEIKKIYIQSIFNCKKDYMRVLKHSL